MIDGRDPPGTGDSPLENENEPSSTPDTSSPDPQPNAPQPGQPTPGTTPGEAPANR